MVGEETASRRHASTITLDSASTTAPQHFKHQPSDRTELRPVAVYIGQGRLLPDRILRRTDYPDAPHLRLISYALHRTVEYLESPGDEGARR